LGIGNSGRYGQVQAKKYGIVISDDAVSDNAATTIATMGQIVLDLTTGEVNYVDSATKTQTLS
ncbi:hypothetical protein LCGC14_2555190, partial [marine sediment metagenome]